jgi:membrane protease YdiL (CAAX protease family)
VELRLPAAVPAIVVRIGFFIFIAFAGLILFGPMLYAAGGYLIAGAIGTFAAAAVANAIAVRVFERKPITAVGLNWHPGWLRNLWLGLAAGAISALLVLGGPVLAGAASLEKKPDAPGSLASALFVSVILVFGAVGEELLFRGYAFQALLVRAGRVATILPSALLFGWAHTANQHASTLGILNTFGFGIVLAYSCVRSGDLWLPIGIHFGWNWILPLAGVSLSGFTMGVTGYAVQWKVSEIWSGGAYGPEASVLTSGVVVALLVFLSRAPVHPQRPPLERGREQEV